MEDEESGNFTDEEFSGDGDPPAPTQYFLLQFVIFIIITLIGLVGNGIVFTIMRRPKPRLTAVNLLLANLAVSDFGVLVLFAPFYLAYDFLELEWPFGLALCKVVFSVTHLCLYVSLGTLVAIAVERYKIAFRVPMKRSQVKVAVALIWLVSALLTTPQLIVYDLVEVEIYEGSGFDEPGEGDPERRIYACEALWPDPVYEQVLQPVDFVLLYLVPLAFIAAIYGRIMYRLGKVNARPRRLRLRHSRGAVKTLALMVTIFAFLNFPIHVFHMYRIFNQELWNEFVWESPWMFSVCVGLVLVMHAANPIIYGIRHSSFRRSVLACIDVRTLPIRSRKRETPQTILQEQRSSPNAFQDVRENQV